MSGPSRRTILAAVSAGSVLPLAAGAQNSGSSTARGQAPDTFGADPTGAQDSTDALKRWAAQGGTLYLPAGSRYHVSDTIVVIHDNTRIGGSGQLVLAPALVGKPLLRIDASDCIVDGIVIANPGRHQAVGGGQTYAILIRGNRNQIRGCTITDFQMCLTTDCVGEFFDNLFAFNYCRVIGVGNAGRDKGEDRGDGITDWGARARIIGNTVEAAPGVEGRPNDCRIGIHVEALSTLAHAVDDPDNAAASEIIGNMVVPSPDGTGRFRRCYSAEGIRNVRIIGNYGRGWTWDGIWLVGASSSAIVSGNVLRHDNPAPAPTDGAEWSPNRAGILVYACCGASLANARVADNLIDLGRADHNGIEIRAAQGGKVSGVVVSDNTCLAAGKSAGDGRCAGVLVTDVDDVQVRGNRIRGAFSRGVWVIASRDVDVEACTISDTVSFAITCQAGPSRMRICGNTIERTADGIESNRNAKSLISGNYISNVAGYGLAFSGQDSALVIGNIAIDQKIKIGRFGVGLNISFLDNIGFSEIL